MSLQSRISDALVLDPSLAGLPITAVASGSLAAVRGPVNSARGLLRRRLLPAPG